MPSSRYYRFKEVSRETRARKREVVIFWFLFTAGFLAIIWVFFMSPFFKITEIILPQNDVLTSGEVLNAISNQMPLGFSSNLFVLSKNRLKNEISKSFPAITKIEVKKEFFHILKIDFQKKIPTGLWCQQQEGLSQTDKCYYVDEEEIIFKEAPTSEGSLILKIKDGDKNDVSPGNKVLNRDQLLFITKFNNKVMAANQFKIIEFKIKSAPDLEAVTSDGWLVYLDQNQDPILAAGNLFTTLDEAVKNKVSNLEYVDLRIPSRIFYKLK